MRMQGVLGAAFCLAAGCGGSPGGTSMPAGCPAALASAGELASTPRADVNLELLALKLSPGKIVADQAIYERVVRDVGAIRAMQPALATIAFFPRTDGRSVDLQVSLATGMQMQAGTYHAWDCLNDAYGAAMPFDFLRVGNADDEFVSFKLKGIYATDRLAMEYARLPGVLTVDGNNLEGDGPTICATTGDATWHYVFDAAGGDCPAGCTTHAYQHFTTEPGGAVTALESWGTESQTPQPAWVAQFASRDACH